MGKEDQKIGTCSFNTLVYGVSFLDVQLLLLSCRNTITSDRWETSLSNSNQRVQQSRIKPDRWG